MGLALFALTYVLIAGFRLPYLRIDRTVAAVSGAAAMVVFGVVKPSALPEAIDTDTLLLLLGTMVISAYLTEAGFFRSTAFLLLKRAHSPLVLLWVIACVSAALSAFLVNDTVCLMLTPLVLAVVEAAQLPAIPYLLALCMASNAGSVATFTGNPQNMLIGNASNIAYGAFAARMAVPAIVCTAIVAAVLSVIFRKQLASRHFDRTAPTPKLDRGLLVTSLFCLAAVVVTFFLGYRMAYCAIAGAVGTMLLARRSPRPMLARVDFRLLAFFAGLFVVVHGVHTEGWTERMRALFSPWMKGSVGQETAVFASLTLLASNLFSNVPYVMVARHWVPSLQDPALGWHVLALASTLAGNLTLLGSVANLIVFEGAKDKAQLSFWGYLRVGVPVTLLSLAAGLVLLMVL